MLGMFRRTKPPTREAGGITETEAIRDIGPLLHLLSDRTLIHVIHEAVAGREMFRDDFLILRLRLDTLYRNRYDKSVQGKDDHL